jgi:putative polyketide hydroxylase
MREASPGERLSVVIAKSLAGPEIFAPIPDELPDFDRYSDAGWAMASQERTERILADRAAELGADLRFGTEVTSVYADECGHLKVAVLDRRTGSATTIRPQYVVAADGHRGRTRNALGIGRSGRGVLSTAMSIVFEADLDSVLHGRRVVLYHMRGPLSGATFATTDDPHRHNVHVGVGDGDWTAARCVEAVRVVTGIPDLRVNVLGYASWDAAAWVADRFAAGRVFLIGDAARVMPPTGGMGGNSAILDAFSLAWKLAMVVRGEAGAGLLASHDAERRLYASELVEQQYARMVDRVAPHRADDTVAAQIDPARFLFGFRYSHGAFTPSHDGEQYDDPDTPSGAPGSRLPLLPPAADPKGYELALLTPAAQWAQQATGIAMRLGIPLSVRRLPDAGGTTGWTRRAGIGPRGAVLVRPDRFVAWRATTEANPAELEQAMRTVFDRRPPTQHPPRTSPVADGRVGRVLQTNPEARWWSDSAFPFQRRISENTRQGDFAIVTFKVRRFRDAHPPARRSAYRRPALHSVRGPPPLTVDFYIAGRVIIWVAAGVWIIHARPAVAQSSGSP